MIPQNIAVYLQLPGTAKFDVYEGYYEYMRQ